MSNTPPGVRASPGLAPLACRREATGATLGLVMVRPQAVTIHVRPCASDARAG